MSDENDKQHDKHVTAATTSQPEEEFISPVNRPSEPEHHPDATAKTRAGEPPRGGPKGVPNEP